MPTLMGKRRSLLMPRWHFWIGLFSEPGTIWLVKGCLGAVASYSRHLDANIGVVVAQCLRTSPPRTGLVTPVPIHNI